MIPNRELNDNVRIPVIGYGTFKISNEEVEKLVEKAINVGYNHIDTATAYNNENGVGKGILNAYIERKKIFVTTKIANEDQGYEQTLRAVDLSLKELGLDYIDLLLIHWPNPKSGETWRAMEELHVQGKVKAIGVSNFHKQHLEKLLSIAEINPMVNQIERHPYNTQKDLELYCKSKGILVQAWSPLAKGEVLNEVLIHQIAHDHKVSVSQIVLRWQIQTGWLAVVKASSSKRMLENISIFDFTLSEDEIQTINSLNRGYRTGSNPDNFEY